MNYKNKKVSFIIATRLLIKRRIMKSATLENTFEGVYSFTIQNFVH